MKSGKKKGEGIGIYPLKGFKGGGIKKQGPEKH